MASISTVLCILTIVSISSIIRASDPDILSDFITPLNSNTTVDGNFFTFTNMRGIFGSKIATFKVTKASKTEFPALDGQSISFAVLQYPVNGINPVHTHPRASELLFVIEGSLEVGFVDTTGKLYAQMLQLGDMFVFPKGLVHYQYNADGKQAAMAISAFGSASAGTVSLPTTLFGTGVDDEVLAKSFKTDVSTIQKIKAGLKVPKA